MSMMNAPGQQQSHDQHHMMGIMAHHGGMATMQPIQQHHPQQQQQQQQQHFSPQSGPGSLRCCAGCGAKIMDRFLLHALDRYWHNGCLKCTCCQATLADIGQSCFTKAGMILCRADYVKMFAPSGGACSACGQMIPASELVMRVHGNVYHVKCFTCVKCHTQLHPGDRFNLLNGSVLCEQDCIKMLKGTVTPAGVRKTKMRVNSAIKV
ncbi:LIM domain transcription factor LMO4-like [Uloborus diversus]|uniref:LIM domain transcription factor LMO4-like n=1 Tax=Uloborus diversus TaxID=327109 RepID=UPI0024094FAA|nr:LIM domain transcription factor LMO4-like [Uloborus diversus]